MNDYAEHVLYRDFAVLTESNPGGQYAAPTLETLGDAIKELSRNIQDTAVPSRVVTLSPNGVDNKSADTDHPVVQPSPVSHEVRLQESTSESGVRSVLTEAVNSIRLSASPEQPIANNDALDERSGIVGTALSVATTVLKSGLGLTPVLQTLFGLFGGDDKPEATPLVKYALPAKLHFNAATDSNGMANIDYDQAGMPRAYREDSSSAAPGLGSSVTVNIQALDARSFLDRSTEIAAAVKEAMLNMNSINDVITDL